jgi:hypothetical protein
MPKCSSKLNVLYVDTLSEPLAQSNVSGLKKAYEKISNLQVFDYRKLSAFFGKELMNDTLYRVALLFRPDLIHLGKSETIQGETIRKIKEKIHTCVVHFYGDYRPEPQPWVLDIGREADITLLYHKDPELTKAHSDAGVKNIGFWWVGVDPDTMYPRLMPKLYDVVFMANNSMETKNNTGRHTEGRRELVTSIANQGIDIHLFGYGWDYFEKKRHVHVHSFVDEHKFAQACSSAKITLGYNTNDVHMYTSWRRPLNSMCCGSFHLTHYFPGLEDIFKNGKHLVWFDSIPEAVELVKFYLVHEEEREKIAKAGLKEVLARHTWDMRVTEIFRYMQLTQ